MIISMCYRDHWGEGLAKVLSEGDGRDVSLATHLEIVTFIARKKKTF